MSTKAVMHTCPNCGGPLEVEGPDVRVVRCGYCGRSLQLERPGAAPASSGGRDDAEVFFEASASDATDSARGAPSPDGPWQVGRSDDCDIVIKDASVSRRHALIQRLPDGTYTLADLASSQGVHVGRKGGGGGIFGKMLGKKKPAYTSISGATVVSAEDPIRIGDVETTVAQLLSRLGTR